MLDPTHDQPDLAADVDADRGPTIAGALEDLHDCIGELAANYAEAVKSRDWLREQNKGLRKSLRDAIDEAVAQRGLVLELARELDHADANGPAHTYVEGDLA